MIIWIKIHPQPPLSHRFMVQQSILFNFQQRITLALIDHLSHCLSLQIGTTASAGSYEIVPSVALYPDDATLPMLNGNLEQMQSHFDEALTK